MSLINKQKNKKLLMMLVKAENSISDIWLTLEEDKQAFNHLPIDEIKKCKNIGITSGASAPEELVQNLIKQIKENCNVTIEEIIVAKENVTFKLPKELN